MPFVKANIENERQIVKELIKNNPEAKKLQLEVESSTV